MLEPLIKAVVAKGALRPPCVGISLRPRLVEHGLVPQPPRLAKERPQTSDKVSNSRHLICGSRLLAETNDKAGNLQGLPGGKAHINMGKQTSANCWFFRRTSHSGIATENHSLMGKDPLSLVDGGIASRTNMLLKQKAMVETTPRYPCFFASQTCKM